MGMNLNDFRKKIPQLEGLDDEAALNLLHEVYYPDADKARMATALGVKITKPEPVRPQNTLMGFIGDRGLDLVKGAVAVPEAAVGVADLVTGGAAGRAAEEVGFRPREAKEILSGMQSDAYHDRQAQFQAADGIVAKTGVALTNPSLIAGAVTESLPLMAAGGVVGRGVMAAAPKLASPVVAGALGEGAVAAGSTAEQVRQQTADGYLTPKQAVLSAAAGVGTAAFGYAGAKAAKAMGIADLDTALVQGSMQAARDSQIGVIKRVAGGMFSESMLEELPQSVVEQMAQNIALDKPVMQDVDSAIVMGALSGAAMGGSAALLSRPKTPTEDAADTIRTNKVPEAGTLSKAVNTGIEASAKAVEATAPIAPAPSLTGFDPSTMIPENPLLAGARVRENDSRQEAMTDQAMAKLERMNANDMAVINSARFDQSRGANEISPTEVVEPAQAGDILNPAGEPFKTRMAADRAAKKTPGAVVPVEGGFVVRPQEPVNVQDVLQAPEVSQAAPAISQPGQAPQAVGAQPAGPAAGVPAEGAGAGVRADGVGKEQFDPEGLKPGTPEYEAAFEKWISDQSFSTKEKAADFVAKSGIKDTHEVVQTGKVRFEVMPKVEGARQTKNDIITERRVTYEGKPATLEIIRKKDDPTNIDGARIKVDGERLPALNLGAQGPQTDDKFINGLIETEIIEIINGNNQRADGQPATQKATDVQADGVTLKKAIDSAYMVANGYFGSDFVGVSIQNDWQRLLDAAGKKDVQALSDLESKYRKDEERDGMGAGTSGAGPGKVKQARRGAAQIPRFAREIRQAIGADLSKNPPNPNALNPANPPTQAQAGTPAEGAGESRPAPVAAPEPTAEQKIRQAFDAAPRTIGNWHKLTVEHNGKTQEFLANMKRVNTSGKRDSAIHLVNIRPGRLMAGDPLQDLAYYYKLDGKNNLVEEGIPSIATPEQLKAFGRPDPRLIPVSQRKQADGFENLLSLKSTKLILDDGRGRKLYDVQVTPAFRNRHFVNGRMPVVNGLELKHKADVTGVPSDNGWVLIDNREQLASRNVPKNQANLNTSAEPAQKTAKSEQVEPFEHAGLKIRPSRVKEGDQVVDRWVVQSPENAEREARGERQIGGDRIVETREQAIKTADQEAKRYAKEKADRAEMDAREKAERDAAEARREANKGKTLTEIKADGYMAQEIKDGKTGDVLTRAEWVKRLVDGGAKLSVEMVNKIKPMSRAAFNRATNQEQAAHEKKVKAAGQVPEYSIGDFIVTKTEYDFAQKLVSSALTADVAAARGKTDIFSAPSEEQVSTKTSEKTGNTTKTYGGYVDGDGVPVELSIVRRADGTLFRVFAKYGDGTRNEFGASYGPGITDEQIVKAVAEPRDWEKVAAKSTADQASEKSKGDRFPSVESITGLRVGPGGTIKPKAIAPGKPLYRETDLEGLNDILRSDSQADVVGLFVSDNPDLAIGQGDNTGVQIVFRPDSLSGKEHVKPMTGELAGREYKTDVVAPRAVQEITMRASDLKSLRPAAKRALSDFDRSDLPGGHVRFTRKAQATHQDPGEKPEAATKGVVNDSLKTAAKNEGTKPSEMRKWLLAEIDKELLQAPDRADYDEAVKRMGEKDAISMFTGSGFLGKNAETGFITFDVPGDGKFKVRNSVRGLLEFRKTVMSSPGFKDSGQRTKAPEQNDGAQDGSGSKSAAVLNMIEEGDFEAARDYAEAVGINLEDVKVPRGDRKPQWEKFLKDGTLPPAAWMPSKEWQFQDFGASSFVPDSEKKSAILIRVADGSTYVATVKGSLDNTGAKYTVTKDGKEIGRSTTRAPFSETLRMAEDAMPEANDKPAPSKASDTGWNMAGTGYGGKRYRGRNITLDDGREVVARIYENAGNYDEVEVKVDGARKFTARDSFNAQDKADAFIRTLTTTSEMKVVDKLATPDKMTPRQFDDWIRQRASIQTEQFRGDRNHGGGDEGVGYIHLSGKIEEGGTNWAGAARGAQDKRDTRLIFRTDDNKIVWYDDASQQVYEVPKDDARLEITRPEPTPKQARDPHEITVTVDGADYTVTFDEPLATISNQAFQDNLDEYGTPGVAKAEFRKLRAQAQAGGASESAATGARRDPTQVSMFNPYNDGDIVTIDGQDWTVKADTPGWYLTTTGNWRGQHPTIRNVKAMADLIREVEQAATAPATEADTPKLTQAEAKELMEWQDLGQKDGVKTHALTFYESQADKDAKRGRMIVAKVSKGDRSATAWMVDGEDKTFGMLAQAKKLAEEVGMAKAVADGFVEPQAAKTAAKPAAPAATIEDAGEKIGGARKDRWKERGLNLDDLDAMTEAEGAELATKANVWKPDYDALAEASEPVTAAMVKTIYDQLAAKPKKNTPEGRRQYVQMMRIVRDVLTDANGPEAVRNAYLEIRKRAGLNAADPAAKAAGRELMFSVYKGRSDPFVLGYTEMSKAKKLVEDGFPAKADPWKSRLSVSRMDGGPGTTERGIEIYVERSAEVGTPLTREQILAGFYRVNTKDSKTVAYAPTKADAEAAAATIYERDMKGKKDGKPEPVRPNLDELKRENLPQRIDRDVTSEDFVRDLGFRGVEFGNWSAQDERQRILNMAYDGLMDLAEIMGVPPKAMSLNGTLGMAFGARGGGRFAAHYEPGKLVINMTKIRGGGSMAHEWAHAMDHYFGELNKDDAYTTTARGASGWYSEDQYLGVPRTRHERIGNEWKAVEKMRLDNLRPEMAVAFDEVMRALFQKQITKAEMVRSHELDLERTQALARSEQDAEMKAMYQNMVQNKREALNELRNDPEGKLYAGRGRSDYAQQAQALSGKSVDGYWVRPTEMFARAFESWVFDKVTAMGARSDYLVHGVEEDRFAGGGYKGNPYPTGEERARINAAFDKLASTIKTKQTDKGVAMFSRATATQAAIGTPAATIRAAITKAYGKLLGQLESKGLVTLTQTEDEAIEAAAQARAAKTGQSVERERAALRASVKNSVADPDIRRSADGAIQGFFDPQTGQSFLVADNLTAEAAPGVLMHEVGIHMAADGSMKALFNRAATMLKLQKGNPFMKAVQARMDAAGETSGEEAAAYIAEAYENDRANAPASVQRWLADLLAAVKAWMFKKGIMGAGRLTVADIAAVARANAKTLARGQQGIRAALAFSKAFQPVWYSALQNSIGSLNMKAAPATGWASTIDGLVKAGKVKADEVEWSGVKEWLQLQTGKVTREQVMEYLDANGVQVQEVVLGDDQGRQDYIAELNALPRDELLERAEELDIDVDEIGGNRADIVAAILDAQEGDMPMAGDRPEGATKYSQYTLPGGENYREVLLTLPRKASENFVAVDSYGYIQERFDNKTAAEEYVNQRDGLHVERDETINPPDLHAYRSSHWDQPNVLAHIRLNDRTDADGKRVLFVEEIQSDWGQAGKKSGFQTADLKIDGKTAEEWQREGERLFEALPSEPTSEQNKAWQQATENARTLRDRARAQGLKDGRQVPNAPFVDKTDKWLSLALKRVITMAAQEGYDRVAFVNGEQSAERYDLSKEVSALKWETKAMTGHGGRGTLTAIGRHNQEIMRKEMEPSEIEDHIGKEVASRLLDAQLVAEGEGRKAAGVRRLSGLDLKVGGEGMKAFYDKIVPNTLKEVLRKVGGGQVETVSLERAGFKYTVREAGAGRFEVLKDGELEKAYRTWDEAMRDVKMRNERDGGETLSQPGFTITPAMREKVAGGLPLFSRQVQVKDQTDTPAFKAWFGGSKVVDADGKPLVVYHSGTFDENDDPIPVVNGEGFHFGTKIAAEMRDVGKRVDDFIKDIKVEQSENEDGDTRWYWSSDGIDSYDVIGDEGFATEEAAQRSAEDFASDQEFSDTDPMPVTAAYLAIKNPKRVADQKDSWVRAVALAKAEGHDGIVYRNEFEDKGKDSYIVFSPTQIKSVNNRGTFDPKDPNIRFSRAADLRKEAAGQVVDLFHTATNVPGRMNWWHKTVGTMYNLAQRSPEFKRVFSAVQDFIDDTAYYADRAARLAPNILPKLETWRDVFKSPMSAVDNRAIRAPIFEGTLTWMRDESGKPVKAEDVRLAAEDLTTDQKAQRLLRNDFVTDSTLRMWRGLPLEQYESIIEGSYERHMLRAGIVFTPDELKSLFKLTDGQVKLYQEFRRATDMSLTNLAISEMVKLGGQDTASMRQAALESEDVVKASAMLRDHLLELADSDAEKSKGYIDAANKIIALSDKAKNLMDKGYAPLSRFGHYTVDVVGPDGTREYFGMFESRFEAAKMAEAKAKNYPDARIERGTVSEQAYKLFAGVTPETIELFGEILGLDTQGDGTQNQAFKAFVQRATANRSAMKRLLERKGIAGFSEDAGRVLAGFVFSNGRRTAGNLHGMEMKEAAEAIPKQQGELKDHAVALVEYVQNPQEEAQGLRGLLFTQYIGGSIASAIVNMTQPLTMSLPYLSQFGGITQAGRQMARAVKDVGKTTTGDKALDAAMTAAEEKGIVSPQEVHQLQQQAAGRAALQVGDGTMAGDARAKAGNALSKTMLAWGKLFSAAEQFNRRVTFIAAYRTAVDRGIENPAKFAEDAVIETQGLYNKGNKPKWARGAIGSTLFTFKQYSVAYVEMLGRLAQSGPEGRRAALYALAILFMLSGAGGMPGADDLDDLISGLMQKLGYNFNSKSARRAFFAKHLGQAGSDFVERGVSGLAGVPIDISGRMGLGNLIPGTGLLTKKTDHTSDVAELAGPAGDLAKRAFQAGSKAMDGDLIGKDGAVTTLAPLAVRNLSQAADMAKHGMYRDARGRKVVETDQLDALSKAFGFQPNDVKRVQDATREVQQMISLNKIRETEIADQWAKAMFERDKDGVQEARDALKRWNADNPESPIRISMQQINKRLANMRMSKEDRMAKTASKEIRATVRRELEAAR